LTDSSKTPTIAANRVERGAKKKRRVPLAVLLVPIALIGIGVILVLTLRGGAVPILGGGQDETTPPFDFTVKGVRPVATSTKADDDALSASAQQVAEDATPTIDDLYTFAFLDPSNWHAGEYDEAFEAFADGAKQTARSSAEVLTLGAGAGDVFETVQPRKSTLAYQVLFDKEGDPNTVVATVVFRALGERKDGTYLAILSEGTLFLRDVDGWKITAFDVTRGDEETEPPSPSPSTSPSA
jgi:hypothetical protein